ncbi:SUMF1/EgtB/PvdO family nonheme iron enzyme [Candidatus Desantisbacteria bacterium]|nr:SUMF1/EgtB/PvdO family nonheme iron enzyme [Candidatus Desantisbacteria bacterium]
MGKKICGFLIIAIILLLLTGCAPVKKTETFTPFTETPRSITPRNITLSSSPSNLRISYNEMNKSVYLLWDELFDIKLYKGGYNIYRSLKEKELYMQINSEQIKDITFLDQNIFEGETYYYTVTGILPNGNESSYSNPIKITIPKGKEKFYDLDALNIDEFTGNILPEAHSEPEIVTTINIPVIFNGTGRDRDGKIIKYEWDFDGNGTYDWSSSLDGPNHMEYPYGHEFSPHKCRNFMKWAKGPAPAGTYKECVSDYGVYDMSGNVWEWTDKPGAIYYGGFWDSGPEDTKCSSKFGLNPSLYYYDLGFRCCQD